MTVGTASRRFIGMTSSAAFSLLPDTEIVRLRAAWEG
jgi:hypothetical protein